MQHAGVLAKVKEVGQPHPVEKNHGVARSAPPNGEVAGRLDRFEFATELVTNRPDGFKAGEKAMVELLANWDAATKAAVQNAEGDAIDGDAVRRVVGSVGTSSPLFGVDKVLKIVGSDLDAKGAVDFIDFTELSDEVVVKLRETNDMAYSAIFSDASGNYGRPGQGSKDYLERSRVALTAALASYRRLLALIPGYT